MTPIRFVGRWLPVAECGGLVLAIPMIRGGGGGGDSSGGAGGANEFGGGTGPGVSGRGLTGGDPDVGYDPVGGRYSFDTDPGGVGQGSPIGTTAISSPPPVLTRTTGGGGGGGGGGGDLELPTPPTDPGGPFDDLLEELIKSMSSYSDERRGYVQPFEQELYRQLTSILTTGIGTAPGTVAGGGAPTGGSGAFVPIIQQAVEQSKQATGMSLAETRNSLAGAGLGNTKFGQQILANTEQAGRQEAAGIPTGIALEAINLGASMLPSANATIAQGYASAGASAASGFGTSADYAADIFSTETQAVIAQMDMALRERLGTEGLRIQEELGRLGIQADIDIAKLGTNAGRSAQRDADRAARNRAIGSGAGAVIGGAVGTWVFPGVGTMAGAAVGGAAGGAAGSAS